jgi:hypothetical protein
MMKYKNLSGQDIGFIVNGKTLDFQNGQVTEVPAGFKESVQKAIDGLVLVEEVKPAQVAPAPVVSKPAVVVAAKKTTVKKATK